MARSALAGTRLRLVAILATVFMASPCSGRIPIRPGDGRTGVRPLQAPRVVLVIAGGISIRDIADPRLKNIKRLFEHGAAGLMNVRTGKPTKDIEPAVHPGMLAGCLTLGAGAMASGGMEVSRAYDATAPVQDVLAGDLYAARTGLKWSPENVLHTEIVKLQRINAAAAYRAKPGILGSILRRAGIKTAVVGASDTPEEIHREAVAAAMDESGKVDIGTVSSPRLLIPDPGSAYGIRTDVGFLVQQVRVALDQCRYVVVDFGDTPRADSYCELCTDKQAAAIRSSAARRLDDLVAKLESLLNPGRDLLVVLSPCSRSFSEIDEERLAPILVSGPAFSGGLLTSPSTRRPGVVTLGDVAPTILDFLGLEGSMNITGRPMRAAPAGDTAATLLRLNLDAANHSQRQAAMRGGSVVQSIIVVLATLVLFCVRSPRWSRAAAWAALIPVILPLSMLYLPLVYSGGLIGSVAVLAGLVVAALAVSIVIFRSPCRALAWLCGLLVLGLAVDIALGSPLIKWSIASYNLVEGARYYGIGNELMGSMLGATLVCVGLMFAGARIPMKARGFVAGAVFAIVFVVIGAPSLGAEAGGAIAAALGFFTAILVRKGWRPSVRGLILIAAVAAVAVAGVFALDVRQAGSAQSHTGRALALLVSGDGGGLLSICARKLELNFMLVSSSLWSRLLGLSLAGSAALYWLSARSQGKPDQRMELGGAAAGLVVGTAAGFVFNDSGVLAAAGSAVMLWSMLVVWTEQTNRTKREPEGEMTRPPALS